MIDTQELRKLAEAAGGGEWSDDLRYNFQRSYHSDDGDLIAALSPRAVLALLDRLDRCEAALQKIVEHARIMTEDYNEAADGPHEVLAQHARTALEGEEG